MQEEIHHFQKQGKDLPKINYGIGINTGEVVLGHIGSKKKLDFTIIGDPVNVASHLCSKAKQNQILIGESTYNYIKDTVEAKKIGPVTLKGKSKSLTVYKVAGRKKRDQEQVAVKNRPKMT